MENELIIILSIIGAIIVIPSLIALVIYFYDKKWNK